MSLRSFVIKFCYTNVNCCTLIFLAKKDIFKNVQVEWWRFTFFELTRKFYDTIVKVFLMNHYKFLLGYYLCSKSVALKNGFFVIMSIMWIWLQNFRWLFIYTKFSITKNIQPKFMGFTSIHIVKRSCIFGWVITCTVFRESCMYGVLWILKPKTI